MKKNFDAVTRVLGLFCNISGAEDQQGEIKVIFLGQCGCGDQRRD